MGSITFPPTLIRAAYFVTDADEVMRLLTVCQVIIMSFKDVNSKFDPILGLIFKDGVFFNAGMKLTPSI